MKKDTLDKRVAAALARGRQAAEKAAAPVQAGRESRRKVQAWLPTDMVRALKLRAAEQDCTMQDLISEAINALLSGGGGRT